MRHPAGIVCTAVVAVLFASYVRGSVAASSELDGAGPSGEEQSRAISGLRPPKRDRPLIAILADNAGTETTDFLVPYGVLTESGVADVLTVAPDASPIRLMPALMVQPQTTIAFFDRLYPRGADYVIVPAMHRRDNPDVLDWIRSQAESGATIVAVCSGALVVAEAGLLDDRFATTHWFDLDALERDYPGLTRVHDRRYVVDRGVATTTGVTASVPISLAIVEAIGGRSVATSLARRIGAHEDWSARHDSDAFKLSLRIAGSAAIDWLSFWGHEEVGVEVRAGFDEIALAFTADAYSRTYRSKAVAVADATGPVTSKRGLILLPERASRVGSIDRFVRIDAEARPVAALEAALRGVRAVYGAKTASFVALQLEYPGWER